MFTFIHFSIQEFLAAYHVACSPCEFQMKFVQENFDIHKDFRYDSQALVRCVELTKGQNTSCFKKFLYKFGKRKPSFPFSRSHSLSDELLECGHRIWLWLFHCFFSTTPRDDEMSTEIMERINSCKTLNLNTSDLLSVTPRRFTEP